MFNIETKQRFTNKIDFTEKCWNWRAYKNRYGYGQFWFNNANISSHRFSYELFKGKIPDYMVIDHLCRNKSCCNPNHLEAVSGSENILRSLK